MIDYNPDTQQAFLSQDLAMKFLVWAVYYNGLELKEDISFSSYSRGGKPMFAPQDVQRLDRVKDALFLCFGAQSVANASAQMQKAKKIGEPCPFSEESLNELFGKACTYSFV